MRFPLRVFARFVLFQSLILCCTFALWTLLLLWANAEKVDSQKIILTFFFLSCVISVSLTLWLGRRFFLPLGRLVEKARSLRQRRALLKNEDNEEEWEELEHAIDQFQTDLRQTVDRMTEGREEIRALMSAISDAVVAFDRGGRTLFYNQQFAATFLPVTEQGRQAHMVDLIREPTVREAFENALNIGESCRVSAKLIPRGEAEPRDYQVVVAPLRRRERAEVYGVIAIFHDVFELKQAERIRIEFVGNASHELRTPLTSIRGYVSTLQSDLKQGNLADADKFLQVISRNVDRLIYLVNDLLDLSSLESHSQQLDMQVVSTKDVTEAVARNLEKEALQKSQKLTSQILAASVYGDVRKIEQVLTNLVQNAIKYIPSNKSIQIIWENDNAGGTVLRVVDDGPGIAKKHVSRLFERFYRVDEGRAREAGGTGLGLAIVKHIMLSHGGSVKVNSEVGRGTEFICHFPSS